MNKIYIRSLALVTLLLANLLVQGQPSVNQNYVMSRAYLQPLSSVPASVTTSQAMTDVSYVDGLGRPLQQVQVKATPDGLMDIVVPVAYDAFGRQDKSYLPYATATGSGGAFKAGAVSAQLAYYTSTPPAGQAANTKPFSVTVFEASPLNRALEQGFPGVVWQPAASRTTTTGRTVVTDRTVNDVLPYDNINSHQVSLYGVNLTSGTPALTLNGVYAAGQLSVTITKDENWNSGRAGTTEEYTDKQGQVLLKRTFNLKDGVQEMLSTYYVYDDFGVLAFVLCLIRL